MSKILGFIGTLRGALIGGALIGIVSMGIGWRAHQILVAAKEAKTLQAKIEIEKDLRTQAETQAAVLSTELNQALNNVQVKYRTVIREIPGVVPKSPSCDLSPAFVRVLNRAAIGGVPANAARQPNREVSGAIINPARGPEGHPTGSMDDDPW